MMEKETILKRIKEYVHDVCANESTGHDWWHIQRVYNNAMLINKKEKANNFILTIIVLMHDLYDHKFYDGNIEEKLKETLKQLQIYEYLSESDIKNIVYSCTNLGFSSNILEKKELSKEGKIAQDADRLDSIRSYGDCKNFCLWWKTRKINI